MSIATEHFYRVASTGWTHCHAGRAQSAFPWPRLTHNALVVLDIDDIFTDVWRFEGKSEFAKALIEKRVRTEGLVEGSAHIVVHRLIKVPGGFQAYFSAVSLELWQRCMEWATGQENHCIVLTASGLLCHGVTNGQVRLLLSQRRLMCFAQTEEGMRFGSTRALGSEASALANAAQVLTSNQGAVLGNVGPDAVQWGTLWSDQSGDSDICLAAVQQALGGTPVIQPAVELDMDGERIETVLPELARAAAGQHALNTLGERLAWRAENWVLAITLVTAVAAVGLMAGGVLLGQRAEQLRLAGQQQRMELQALRSRIESASSIQAPDKLVPAAEFARTLDGGAQYDPVAFISLLKQSIGPGLRIQRVRLEPAAPARARAFRVDGVVAAGSSAPVTRWVSAMAAAGWSLKALDPADGGHGAFSYEVVAVAPASRNVKP